MKKFFALFLVLILIFSLCACDNSQLPNSDNQNKKYKLTVIDYWGNLIKPLNEYYEVGEKVEVTLKFSAGPAVGIELNGEYIGESRDTYSDGINPVIIFTMPEKDSVLFTTLNKSIGFHSTFSRAGSGRDPAIWSNALNANKLTDENSSHLPVYKFDTLSDLQEFKNAFGGEGDFNFGWDEVPSFNKATKVYDAAFFEKCTLLLVCVEAGSGSYRFGLKDITISDNYFCVNIEQTNNPQGVTDDMAAWFITVDVPDNVIENYTEFDAVFIENNTQTELPDDFSFELTWGVYGISSYNSQTGKLVKTIDATNPEDYVTYYQLTKKEKEDIYSLLMTLDVNSYPDIYDPQNGMSEPSATLILKVRMNGETKTIKAEDISLFFVSEDKKGQLFLDTCEAISNLLKSTDEWKALPDYENLYE